MQKEEFPTFLNEQPTVVFGRTSRELMIMAIGITLGYLCWMRLSLILAETSIGIMILKAIISALPMIGSVVIALVSIAGRPLEEWAFAGLFYFLIPKVYIYMPSEETEQIEDEEEQDDSLVPSQSSNLRDDNY
jgi:hypothetical protein